MNGAMPCLNFASRIRGQTERASTEPRSRSRRPHKMLPLEHLWDACRTGNVQRVDEALLGGHVDPGAGDDRALCLACENGHVAVVQRLLLDDRVDPNRNGGWPLRVACEHGRVDVVSLLLSDGRADPTLCCGGNLVMACKSGDCGLVRELLSDARVADQRNYIVVAMDGAIERDRIDVVRMLLDGGHMATCTWDDQPIHAAVRNGCVAIFHELMARPHPDVAQRDTRALLWAVEHGQAQLVDWILHHCPLVDVCANDHAPLCMASFAGHVEMVRQLLRHERVYPAARRNEPLRIACARGHEAIVALLLADARVDPADLCNGALTSACMEGHEGIVARLLASGRVDPSAARNVAIRVASARGHVRVVQMLLHDSRVDPSAYNNDALHKAVLGRHEDVVRALLARDDVDPSACNRRALDDARRLGAHAIESLLLMDRRLRPSARV